jgi:uncharacterized protein (DUF4415 family)
MNERILDNIAKPSYEQLAEKLKETVQANLRPVKPKPEIKKQVNIRVNEALLQGLEEFQAQYGVNMSWVVNKLLADFLQRVKHKKDNWSEVYSTEEMTNKIF